MDDVELKDKEVQNILEITDIFGDIDKTINSLYDTITDEEFSNFKLSNNKLDKLRQVILSKLGEKKAEIQEKRKTETQEKNQEIQNLIDDFDSNKTDTHEKLIKKLNDVTKLTDTTKKYLFF